MFQLHVYSCMHGMRVCVCVYVHIRPGTLVYVSAASVHVFSNVCMLQVDNNYAAAELCLHTRTHKQHTTHTQLSCELVSNVLQVDNVYAAELVNRKHNKSALQNIDFEQIRAPREQGPPNEREYVCYGCIMHMYTCV